MIRAGYSWFRYLGPAMDLDLEGLAAAMEKLLTDVDLRTELRQKGLAHAARFSTTLDPPISIAFHKAQVGFHHGVQSKCFFGALARRHVAQHDDAPDHLAGFIVNRRQ